MAKLGIAWVVVYSASVLRDYSKVETWTNSYLECYDWLHKHPEEALQQTKMALLTDACSKASCQNNNFHDYHPPIIAFMLCFPYSALYAISSESISLHSFGRYSL